MTSDERERQESRFRTVFKRVHAAHPRCLEDEWLTDPCRDEAGAPVDRPVVWSRRNGAWRRVEILWVGAAPGNAGGKGSGDLGAHGTRIPFGGDLSGANVDALFGSIGVTRNDTFIAAALNQLPVRGGGEPALAELVAPVGDYATSLHLLHDTIVAAGPRLIVAFGNVALRAVVSAARLGAEPLRLPSLARLARAGLERGAATPWPAAEPPGERFLDAWRTAWRGDPLPALLFLLHPSAQNMSPFAGTTTRFHARMLETRAALRRAARDVLGLDPPADRPPLPTTGIYALPEWRDRIAPRHARLDRLWREKGV
ncbi:MAG TPA: uracil-DNA glycosylase family protein [Longimicrobiales bacterium]